jgi:hypothetical protein
VPSNAELFLKHLDKVFGEEDAIHQVDADDGGPPVTVFVYRNVPEEGMITGVTYGLSVFPLPAWKLARPEMIVSVQSLDLAWPCAAATFAATFRGEKTFEFGDVFTTDCPLAPDTKMDGFLVFAQSILPKKSESVRLDGYKVHLYQFYPRTCRLSEDRARSILETQGL